MRGISKRTRRGALVTVVALLAPVAVVLGTAAPGGAALPGCTRTWTATTNGSWDDAANWSGNAVPLPTDHVCIDPVASRVVTIAATGAPIVVASLRLGATSGSGTQTLRVHRGVADPGTSLTATQGIEITPRGSLLLGHGNSAPVSVGVGPGATLLNDGKVGEVSGQAGQHTLRGNVVDTGVLTVTDAFWVRGDLTVEGDGHLAVDHVLHVEGTVWTKGGTVDGDWVVVAYDGLRVGDAGTDRAFGAPPFVVEGGDLSYDAESPIEVVVRGQVDVNGDTAPGQDLILQTVDGLDTTLTFSGTWNVGGLLRAQPGETADVVLHGSEADATLVNQGQLTRYDATGAALRIEADLVNQGSLDTNGGTIDVTGDVRNDGEVELHTGRVDAGGALVLGPRGRVSHDLLTADDFAVGRLTAEGPVTVGGALRTRTDLAPAVGGVTSGIVTGSSRTGTFRDLQFSGPASFDPQYTSTAVNLVRRASEPADHRFVRAAFQDFLGRQPNPAELASRSSALTAGTLTRAGLVRELSLTPEYVGALVERFYVDTLGRPGDPSGTAYWVGQLRDRRRTVAEVAGSFYASNEYFTWAGGTDADWIDKLYYVFFERLPSSSDLAYWTGRTQAEGRTRVAILLFQSLESRRQRVDRLYHELLGRASEPGGVDYWAARLLREGDLALGKNLASSLEYASRAQVRYP